MLDLENSIFAKIKNKVFKNAKKDVRSSKQSSKKNNVRYKHISKSKAPAIGARSSITHVYFDVHDSKKKILKKDSNGIYYLGKAVFKNKVRKKISIKQYTQILSDSEFLKLNCIIKELKNLKRTLDKKRNILNNKFQNINLIKIQTERCLSAEWVLVGPVFDTKKKTVNFLDSMNVSKNINLILEITSLLIENSYEPTDSLVYEFLNNNTDVPLDLDLISKNKFKLKSIYNKYKSLISKISYFAKYVNKNNKSVSEYNKLIYEYSSISLKNIKNYKLKKLLQNYISNIRFDK